MRNIFQNDTKNKILDTYIVLVDKGLTPNEATSLLVANPDLLKQDINDLESRLSVIYNYDQKYAMLLCEKNELHYSLYRRGKFDSFHYSKKGGINDYIIKMMVDSATNNKIFEIDNSIDLEERFNRLKKVKVNKRGYHVK